MIIRLADESDDVQLRNLMRGTVLPGHIRMRYTREPNYFDFHRNTADDAQTLVAEENGRIVGMGCRSIRWLYVNGRPESVGYLSGLRVAPAFRNSTLLARGYAFLRELHADNRVPAYLTTIIHGNERAMTTLTGNRASLPAYSPIGDYLTHVLLVPRASSAPRRPGALQILSGEEIKPGHLYDFLDREGAGRQFFPVCEFGDQGARILESIGLDNLFVASKGGEIVGTMAIWDQQDFRQYFVAGYSPWFRACLPVLNAGLRLAGHPSLPKVGDQLRTAAVGAVCIRDNTPAVFRHLLRYALAEAASRGLHQLVLGLHEHDPLRLNLRGSFRVVYRSHAYLVEWDRSAIFHKSLEKDRVPYLELGIL